MHSTLNCIPVVFFEKEITNFFLMHLKSIAFINDKKLQENICSYLE